MESDLKRREMVAQLKAQGIIKAHNVEEAMLKVRREDFVWPGQQDLAYDDNPLPLGDTGQTLSAPHMIAIMLEELELSAGQHVLEVGTGSGYNAALIASIVGSGGVVSIERLEVLVNFAKGNLEKTGYSKFVLVIHGDGTLGYPPESPKETYDRIIVTACAPSIPKTLCQQLKKGGIMLIPVGSSYIQDLLKLKKNNKGEVEKSVLGSVAFVPLVGKYAYNPS
ncbi:MAG: protein-L-isoaspartate(D-aspartate) O-methyltransferase [Conexivisphaerales archaeon]